MEQSPAQEQHDLWSSILDSVSSTRSIPSKNVIILGEPSTGKSNIAAALLQKPNDNDGKDFAIGYDWVDVKDEADEAEVVARLSVYTVPSSSNSHLSLLPHFLSPRQSLHQSVFIVVLDWTRPWTFMEQLQLWISWIENWARSDPSRETAIVCEENKERLQSFLQTYVEPSSNPLPLSSSVSNALLPLGSGTLTDNFSGVPIIVTCAKSDLIDEDGDTVGVSTVSGMVKGKGSEWEERTDTVMQILRTVCLKYGAALFYTTTVPQTLAILRQYTLHLLFMPPSPSLVTASGETPVPYRNPFTFNHKANLLDRDRIIVPMGWDSWGKIAVLRDGFDTKGWGEAWDFDLQASHKVENEDTGEPSAKQMYARLVPDRGVKPTPFPPFNDPVPEQTFLAKNFDDNAKKPDKDPRGAFRNPNDIAGFNSAGIVGPLGSSSFNLPAVERALVDMESDSGIGSGVSGDTRKGLRKEASSRSTNLIPSTSRPSTVSPTSANGQSQHDVLHNFFQSLLVSRGTPMSSSRPHNSGAAQINGVNSGSPTEAPEAPSATE